MIRGYFNHAHKEEINQVTECLRVLKTIRAGTDFTPEFGRQALGLFLSQQYDGSRRHKISTEREGKPRISPEMSLDTGELVRAGKSGPFLSVWPSHSAPLQCDL